MSVITENNQRLEISYEEDSMSPREWDNLGIMAYAHPSYVLGDKKDRHAMTRCTNCEEECKEECECGEYSNIAETAMAMLPLYLYDHSGVTMRTTPFGDPWDSGQVGIIYVTKEKCVEIMGTTDVTQEKLEEILRGEVKEFDQYLRGEIYRYAVYDENDNVVDSCGGFYDTDSIFEDTGFAKQEVEL